MMLSDLLFDLIHSIFDNRCCVLLTIVNWVQLRNHLIIVADITVNFTLLALLSLIVV